MNTTAKQIQLDTAAMSVSVACMMTATQPKAGDYALSEGDLKQILGGCAWHDFWDGARRKFEEAWLGFKLLLGGAP